jgi:hypothetical protein
MWLLLYLDVVERRVPDRQYYTSAPLLRYGCRHISCIMLYIPMLTSNLISIGLQHVFISSEGWLVYANTWYSYVNCSSEILLLSGGCGLLVVTLITALVASQDCKVWFLTIVLYCSACHLFIYLHLFEIEIFYQTISFRYLFRKPGRM